METEELIVPRDQANVRIDFFLVHALQKRLSRTKIKALIESGHVTLNGRSVKPHTHILPLDRISVSFEKETPGRLPAEEIPLDIVYEDEDVIVLNKPAGLVVHPGCGNPNGTLLNALLHYTQCLSHLGEAGNPGLAHRLDKDTSGLIVAAKNDRARDLIASQFKRREVEKVYWVAVRGVVEHDELRAAEPIGRSLLNRKKMVVRPDTGKASLTHFRVLKRFPKATLLEARPLTGRMHQIRVHLRTLGHPVLGDLVYGVPSPYIHRQALHAKELAFTHPSTKKRLHFAAELPEDMKSLLKSLETA